MKIAMSLLLMLLGSIVFVGCKCANDSPSHDKIPKYVEAEADPELVAIYNDYKQGSRSRTILTKLEFDGHDFILLRAERSEGYGQIIHHPDCCKY